jgi:putative peptidoglycan lipid II flippase
VAWGVGQVLPGAGDDVSHLWAGIRLVVLSGVDVAVFLVLARALRLSEVTTVVDTLVRRFPGARHS